MSKASDFAKLRKALIYGEEHKAVAWVTQDGRLGLTECNEYGGRNNPLAGDEACALARWILDTFEDAPRA